MQPIPLRTLREQIDEILPQIAPDEKRIAAFDFDGTLVSQNPSFAVVEYFIHESDITGYIAPPDNSGASTAADYAYRKLPSLEEIVRYQIAAFAGKRCDEVAERAHAFYTKHYAPRIFTEQKAILDALRAAGFEIYVISGSAKLFIERFISAEFGVPSSHIIATADDATTGEHVANDWRGVAIDGTVKVREIERRIGAPPAIAIGNSMGDIPMLAMAKWLSVIINPDEHAHQAFSGHVFAKSPQRKDILAHVEDPPTGLNRIATYLR